MIGLTLQTKHPNARYYVIEGPDGTGKSTQAKMLADHFRAHLGDDRVLLTSQPWYEGYRGGWIKQYLRGQFPIPLSPGQVFDLYVENRRDHLKRFVIPALEAGKVVVQDRSYYSTFAYQGSQDVPLDQIVEAHRDMQRPDMVFIMKTSLDVSQERLRQRHVQTGHAPETFESRPEQEQIAKLFDTVSQHFPDDPIYFVDAVDSPEEVHGLLKQMTQSDLETLL